MNDAFSKAMVAQLVSSQQQALAVLAAALGDVVGSQRLADALEGRLAELDGDATSAPTDQLFAAALLGMAVERLKTGAPPQAPQEIIPVEVDRPW